MQQSEELQRDAADLAVILHTTTSNNVLDSSPCSSTATSAAIPASSLSSSPFSRKLKGGLFERRESTGGSKNEDHRLSAKLAYLRSLQSMKLSELEKIEQQLYTRSSSVSQLESKLIDLDRSAAAMVSKSKDLLLDRDAKEALRQGLIAKQRDFSQRSQACAAEIESLAVQESCALLGETVLDHDITVLQEEQLNYLRRIHDIDLLLDANRGMVEQKESASKALHSKLKDVKRHLLMVRTETLASREQDARKGERSWIAGWMGGGSNTGHKSDLTVRLERKQEQLEEKEKDLSSQLRVEHGDIKELKARMTQKRQDKQGLVLLLEPLKQRLANLLDQRTAKQLLLTTIEAKRVELQTTYVELQSSSKEVAKILQNLDVRLLELEKDSSNIRDHLQEIAQQRLLLNQTLQDVQTVSRQLQSDSNCLHAEVQALVARIDKTQKKLFRVQGEPLFVRSVDLLLSKEECVAGLLTITQSLVIFAPAVESLKEGHLYRLCGEISEMIEVEISTEDNQDVLEIHFVKDLCVLHASHPHLSPMLESRLVSSSFVSSSPLAMLPPPALPSISLPFTKTQTSESVSSSSHSVTYSPSFPPCAPKSTINLLSVRTVRFRGRHLRASGEQLQSKLPETKEPDLPNFELLDQSELLSDAQIRNIVAFAPQRFGVSSWRLAYSLSRDGADLNQFYAAQEGAMACLIIIQDSNRSIFGGFTASAWKQRVGHYGSGESFVFTVAEEVLPYRWSGVNCFFMMGTNRNFAMGGGDHFAFSIDSHLRTGVSGSCSTYNSPQLSAESMFSLDYLEAWVPISEFG